MAVQSDFMTAIHQIAAERNIDTKEILDAIKFAIKAGFKKDEIEEEEGAAIEVEIDENDGSIAIYMDKKVVKNVTDPVTQIDVVEAQKLEPMLRIGDHVEVDVTPEGDFGRVAAQAAKQVILQKLRESEKEAQISKVKDQIGNVMMAIVQRMDGDSVIWEINRTPAIMPQDERIPSEFYRSGSRHKVLLKEIRETPRGKQIVVSRSDEGFLKGLFELEIPELSSGATEIKGVAREPGQRSKVAVTSNVEGIDPIGSCVGQKGVRIMGIMEELKIGNIEEKIDIILWDEDIEQYVVNALSPAQVVKTELINKEEGTIRVTVPDEQLSLAIGRDGQNVRLAAKLTGMKIDIQGETVKIKGEEKKKDKEEVKTEGKVKAKGKEKKETKSSSKSSLEELGLSTKVINALSKEKIEDVETLKKLIESGEKIKGVGPKSMEEIKTLLK